MPRVSEVGGEDGSGWAAADRRRASILLTHHDVLAQALFEKKDMAWGAPHMIDTSDPVVARMLAHVRDETPMLVQLMTDEIVDRVHIYRSSLKSQLISTVTELLTRFGRGDISDTDELIPWVANAAEQRMSHGIPLEDLLAGWRIGTDVLWAWYLEVSLAEPEPAAALRLWTQLLQYIDRDIAAVSAVYAAARDDSRINEVARLEAALEADHPSDVKAALRDIGVAGEQVVVVMCTMPGQRLERPRTWADRQQYGPALGRLTTSGRRPVSAVRDGRLVTVVDSTPQLRRLVDESSELELRGVHIGLSRPVAAGSSLRPALLQAAAALQCTTALAPIRSAADLGILEAVATRTTLDWADVPDWVKAFLVADSKQHGEFRETARALLASDGRVSDAAERLNLHPNTIYYRITLVQRTVGVNLRKVDALGALQLVEQLLVLGRIEGVPAGVQATPP